MKIFHTSDLHLSEKKKGTIHTLEYILEIAKSIGVDLVTIGGDFFDSDRDVEEREGEGSETERQGINLSCNRLEFLQSFCIIV